MMKRAPVIPKHNLKVTHEITDISPAPAAPVVDSLISRVGSMAKGNAIVLPVCGRDVRFILETVPSNSIEKNTRVWLGNERDQELLTEDALDDLLPSFRLTGQQTPAFGRKQAGIIEIADGSRRRKAAILSSTEYRVLVGELDDEQMSALSRLGNDYRPTSAYERGLRYLSRLDNEFSNNISALAEAENISRKIISRCMNTAHLPKNVVALFSHPGELSARSGEMLFKAFKGKEAILQKTAEVLTEKKKAGVIFEPDELISILISALKSSEQQKEKENSLKKQLIPGAFIVYKGDKVIFNLDRSKFPDEYINKITMFLQTLKTS